MGKLDEESEELPQKFLEKYKKLRTAYHKQALLHLAGQTSLRWYPAWHRVQLCCIPARLFLFYTLLGPVLWVQLLIGLSNISGELEIACIVTCLAKRLAYSVLVFTVTKLVLFVVIKPFFNFFFSDNKAFIWLHWWFVDTRPFSVTPSDATVAIVPVRLWHAVC